MYTWMEYLRDGRKQSVEEVQELLGRAGRSLDDFTGYQKTPIPVRTGPDSVHFEQYFRGADIRFGRDGNPTQFVGAFYVRNIEPTTLPGLLNEDNPQPREKPLTYRDTKHRVSFKCRI